MNETSNSHLHTFMRILWHACGRMRKELYIRAQHLNEQGEHESETPQFVSECRETILRPLKPAPKTVNGCQKPNPRWRRRLEF